MASVEIMLRFERLACCPVFQFHFSLAAYNHGDENSHLEQSHERQPKNAWEMELFPDRCSAGPLFEHRLYAREHGAKTEGAGCACFDPRFSGTEQLAAQAAPSPR